MGILFRELFHGCMQLIDREKAIHLWHRRCVRPNVHVWPPSHHQRIKDTTCAKYCMASIEAYFASTHLKHLSMAECGWRKLDGAALSHHAGARVCVQR